MFAKNSVLRAMVVLVILTAVITACKPTKAAASLQNGEYKNGTLILDLQAGKYSLGYPNQDSHLEEGSYALNGDQITFHVIKFSSLAAAGCGTIPDYSYGWTYDPKTNQLTFGDAKKDACTNRVSDFTAASLAYVEGKQ